MSNRTKPRAPRQAETVAKPSATIALPPRHDPRPIDTRWPQEILVGKRHRKDFGDMDGLIASINARGGLLHRIAITSNNELIAGERRLRAWRDPKCRFAPDPVPVHVIDIDSILLGEWDENAMREAFRPTEIVAIKREMDKILKPAAEERKRAHGGTAPGRKTDKTRSADAGAAKADAGSGRVIRQIAKATGRGARTIEKAEQVVAAAEAEPEKFGKLVEDMDRTGRVDGPHKRMQVIKAAEEIRKAPPGVPMAGPYNTIVIDCPWANEPDMEQEEIDAKGRSLRPYPAMSNKALAHFMREKVAPILAPDCVVYFWVTNFHMPFASHILAALGFTQHSTIGTWVKNKMGRGQILRDQTEHCIIAKRGKPVINLTNQTTAWQGEGWERRENSRKPAAFYQLVEQLTPAPRYASIFSTGGEGELWDSHGDQVGKHAPGAVPIAAAAAVADPAGPDAGEPIGGAESWPFLVGLASDVRMDKLGSEQLRDAMRAHPEHELRGIIDRPLQGDATAEVVCKCGWRHKTGYDSAGFRKQNYAIEEHWLDVVEPVRAVLQAPAIEPTTITTSDANGTMTIKFPKAPDHVVTWTVDHRDASTSFDVVTCRCGWSEKLRRTIDSSKRMSDLVRSHGETSPPPPVVPGSQEPADMLDIPGFLRRKPAEATP